MHLGHRIEPGLQSVCIGSGLSRIARPATSRSGDADTVQWLNVSSRMRPILTRFAAILLTVSASGGAPQEANFTDGLFAEGPGSADVHRLGS
jgi:hypothetical protein